MKDIPDPALKNQDSPEKELCEETLSEVNGGRRQKLPERRDVEIEGGSQNDPRLIRKAPKVVDL